jgi:hemerythrin superfamily protein
MLVATSDYHGLLFDRLAEEHREILTALEQALSIGESDPHGRREAFRHLARTIRIHARAEEEVVFPPLDGSYELGHHVREDVAQHRAIEEQLRDIELGFPSGAAWLEAVRRLRTLLLHNFADEEGVVFPRAHNVISDPAARDLLVVYEQQREVVEHQLP